MTPRRAVLALLLALATAPAAGALEPLRRNEPFDPILRLGWVRELSGSCWQGKDADGKAAGTVCWSTPYGRFVQAVSRTRVPRGAESVELEETSLLAWDPVSGNIEIFTWASDGTWRRGEAIVFREVYRFWDRAAGAPEPLRRTIWRRRSPTSYEVSVDRRDGDRWVDVRVITYERVKAEPPPAAPAPAAP